MEAGLATRHHERSLGGSTDRYREIQLSRRFAALISVTRPRDASALNAAMDSFRSDAVGQIPVQLPPLASVIKNSTASYDVESLDSATCRK
jgi:hypothetical protein